MANTLRDFLYNWSDLKSDWSHFVINENWEYPGQSLRLGSLWYVRDSEGFWVLTVVDHSNNMYRHMAQPSSYTVQILEAFYLQQKKIEELEQFTGIKSAYNCFGKRK